MQIETDRLILKPFQKSDLHDLAILNADAETMKYISPPLTREHVAGVIDWFLTEWQRLGFGWFAVFERPTNRFIGQCGLQGMEGKPDSSDVELGFKYVDNRHLYGREVMYYELTKTEFEAEQQDSG